MLQSMQPIVTLTLFSCAPSTRFVRVGTAEMSSWRRSFNGKGPGCELPAPPPAPPTIVSPPPAQGGTILSREALVDKYHEEIIEPTVSSPAEQMVDALLERHWWEYDGVCPFAPSEWQPMVGAMRTLQAAYPAVQGWSEIVYDVPPGGPSGPAARDAVAAVAWFDDPSLSNATRAWMRAYAAQEAAAFSPPRHVLAGDGSRLARGGPLFVCDPPTGAGPTAEEAEAEVLADAQADELPSLTELAELAELAPRRGVRSAPGGRQVHKVR